MLVFLVSVIGMTLILKSRGFYPFKDKTMFVLDMKSQYLAFFASLRSLFTDQGSLFFSWSRSMGGNYIGLFAYYLASPFSWITVLFPLEKLSLAIFVMTVLKISCCSVSFAVYEAHLWKRAKGKGDIRTEWNCFLLLPFAVCYGLMSYNILYAMCPMWLDAVLLLPLVLLGVEKILEGGRGLFYAASMLAVLLCNYYTGYMVGIFSALYVMMRFLTTVTRVDLVKKLLALVRYGISSILAVGASAILLLPSLNDLASGKLSHASPFSLSPNTINFSIKNFLYMFHSGAYWSVSTAYSVGMPTVYCGYLALLGVAAFFIVKRIPLREKIGTAVLLAFMFCSFYFSNLNKVWHGFANPTFFPFRYSFLFSFLMLYMTVRAVTVLPVEKIPDIWQHKPVLEGVWVLLMLIVAVDMGWNGREILFQIDDEFNYSMLEDFEKIFTTEQPLVEEIKAQDAGLYRIRQTWDFTRNEGLVLGYNGMDHYSSTYNENVNRFLRYLGMAQDSNWSSSYGGTPLLDGILGVKYLCDTKEVTDNYTRISSTEWGTYAYQNSWALPFVYSAPVNNLSLHFTSMTPFDNQNMLLNTIADKNELYFTAYEYIEEQQSDAYTYSFTADSTNPVYLYVYSPSYGGGDVEVNGELAGDYFTTESKCCLYLGSFEPGEQVRIDIRPNLEVQIDAVYICQLHINRLQGVLSSLQSGGMTVEEHRCGVLKGEITVGEGELILTSIPCDDGWTIALDGNKVEPVTFADTFIAVPASVGTHELVFSYISPGFVTGCILTGISMILGSIYFGFPVWYRKKRLDRGKA